MSVRAFGIALVDRAMLAKVELLWEGPLDPAELPDIEVALRAFVVGRRLGVLPNLTGIEDPNYDDNIPFHDHLLDYEFDLDMTLPKAPLSVEESDFLSEFIHKRIVEEFFKSAPAFNTMGEAHEYLAEWYGDREHVPLDRDFKMPYDKNELMGSSHIFHKGPGTNAHLIVELTRNGYHLYSNARLFDFCAEHLFSRWPDKIFAELEEEYLAFSRSLRGPGTGIELPPLTALVMSRAPTRSAIPKVLVEMREEFQTGRDELWALLSEMWTASSLKQQQKHLRKLNGLGKAIFKSAFAKNFDVLSLGLELAKVSPSGIAGFFDKGRQQGSPMIQVHAISFAERLSHDFTNYLMSNHGILKRHLTPTERRDFGMV